MDRDARDQSGEHRSGVDPLIVRALRLFSGRGNAADTGDVDEIAGQLLADELIASSSYEVGTWGQAPFKAAARAAARLRLVAVGGDEVPSVVG